MSADKKQYLYILLTVLVFSLIFVYRVSLYSYYLSFKNGDQIAMHNAIIPIRKGFDISLSMKGVKSTFDSPSATGGKPRAAASNTCQPCAYPSALSHKAQLCPLWPRRWHRAGNNNHASRQPRLLILPSHLT